MPKFDDIDRLMNLLKNIKKGLQYSLEHSNFNLFIE